MGYLHLKDYFQHSYDTYLSRTLSKYCITWRILWIGDIEMLLQIFQLMEVKGAPDDRMIHLLDRNAA